MKLALALSSLVLSFFVFAFSAFATPPSTGLVLLTCTEKKVDGTSATVHLDLVKAGTAIYLNSSLNMIPEFIPMKRTSLERFLGGNAEYSVALIRNGGQDFTLSVEKSYDPNMAWTMSLKLQCVAPAAKVINFCESYENFEECRQNNSGPDDVNDGDGGRDADPENPDHPGDDGL